MRAALIALLLVVGTRGISQAQTAAVPELPAGRFDAAFGIGWLGGAGLADRDANLRTRDGGDYRLFSTSSRFAGTTVLETRVGYGLTRRYRLEGRIGFSHPELRSSVTADAEGAPDIELAERVDQYTFEGALVVRLPEWRMSSLVPFVAGGAGYLRQLHEGQTLVEEGVAYQVGGGVTRPLFVRQGGWVKAASLRGDVRLHIFTGGIHLDEGARIHPSVAASVEVMF